MRLPLVSGREVVKALLRIGYFIVRQRGSHIRLYHPSRKAVSVPNHYEVDRKTLAGIITDAGLEQEEFLELL